MRIPIENPTSYRGRNARPNWVTLLLFVGVALGAGAIGFLFSPAHSPATAQWYAGAREAAVDPPSRWFGPVWTALYCLMGTAAWLVSRERYHEKRSAGALGLFRPTCLECGMGAAFLRRAQSAAGCSSWSRCGSPSPGRFAHSRPCAPRPWMLVPYLAWTTYAMALNFSLWRLNQ